ncbi:MAG: hypothetical protein ACFE78_06785 [Candidatus Hodarchaeota archaeon]
MTLKELGIEYKKIDNLFVGYINFKGEIPDIPDKIDEFYEMIKDHVSGPAIAVIDYGVYSEGGKDIDICFPLEGEKELKGINTKYLESIEVLSIMHQGTSDSLGETYQKIHNYTDKHMVSGTAWLRLVYHRYNQKSPKENRIEIQHNLHKWANRLERSIDKVLGKNFRNEIMKEKELLFTVESSREDRTLWLKDTLDRLDKVVSEDQKYEIVSRCAHEFSPKRIENLKNIYEKTGDIDEVIKKMQRDYAWYENPIRKGNIIYITKIPANPEGYEKAETLEEKKKNYCHCRFINENLDKGISPTFCYCGTGWYRQQWEGILRKPVKIKILKSLLREDNTCEVAIHLPPELNLE